MARQYRGTCVDRGSFRLYLILLCHGLVAIAPASAAQFEVTTAADGADAAPGDGRCATPAGDCSLRAAVEEANAIPGFDTVVLPPGIHLLEPQGLKSGGRIEITDDLELLGAGADRTYVDGGGRVGFLNVVHGVRVRVAGLTVRDGWAGESAIVENSGHLHFEHCGFTGNDGEFYGAVIMNYGSLTVRDSLFEDNRSQLIEDENCVQMVLDGVVMRRNGETVRSCGGLGVRIVRSEVIDNAVGIWACAVLEDSIIRDNQAFGVACQSGGVLVSRSTISGNGQAGINSDGSVWVIDSTISGNGDTGGFAVTAGLGAVGSGGIVAIGTVVVQRSTIADNLGVGIDVEIDVELDNTTITGNRSGGVRAGGGVPGSSRIESSTIVDNDGVGIAQNGEGNIVVRSSIIAGNLDVDGLAADCRGEVEFAGLNIIGSTDRCDSILAGSDRVGVDPLLGPLQDNGGPTLTRAPLNNSPAIDGGASPGSGICPPVDQRGAIRPQGERCDVGAVERLVSCGDLVVDPGENCDAGGQDGDGCCTALCRFNEVLIGDCHGDGSVSVDELVLAVVLALDGRPAIECRATDRNGDMRIDIAEIIAAVRNSLEGVRLSCSAADRLCERGNEPRTRL